MSKRRRLRRSTNRRAIAVLVAALVVISITAVGYADAKPIEDLDEETPLTSSKAWSTYQDKGKVTVDVSAPELTITVAKEKEGVGLDGFSNDYLNEYLRIKYHEDIERKIRFYIPSNYVDPYFEESAESETDDTTARFVPVENGRYMAVTITFTGKADATFKVSQGKGKTWAFWAEKDESIENETGVSAGLAGNTQWTYAESSQWSDDGFLKIEQVEEPDRVEIQYDADVSPDSQVWLKAHEGDDGEDPVYYLIRRGSENDSTIVIVSRDAANPPPVRYKKSVTGRDIGGSIWRDFQLIPKRINDFISSIFGNGSK